MRLSLTPFIALLASALSFLFAYMTEGMGLLSALFSFAGVGALVCVVFSALHALYRFALAHRPAGASQKPQNHVNSSNQTGR